ncbi:hypothetical protein B0H21DRAFT_715931 [Amylocystis lapponica]|nr:hypothetical protein B0H21DRAFT_715931 [Amylocystis lapponica]
MNDPDVERALTAFRFLSDTCSTASDVLQQSVSAPLASSSSAPTCAVLHKDFTSLLSLTYASTTKVTLACRPPEPAYSAALAPLRDLSGNVSALTTCATLFDEHGATLAAEARLATREICQALHALAQTFLEDAGKDYLVRTGAVHDAVDKARALSVDNCSAVRRRWALDKEMLDDAASEVAGMLEDAGEDAEEEDDGFDDEWRELGLGPSKKMTGTELERTKKIQPLLRFIVLLHKRVLLDILSNPSPTSPHVDHNPHTILDAFPPHSHTLVLASEELVAALYAPQDQSDIVSAVSALADVVHRLHQRLLDSTLLSSVRNSMDELTNGVGALSVTGTADSIQGSRKKQKDVRKWFDTCFAQIGSLTKSVVDTLGPSNET